MVKCLNRLLETNLVFIIQVFITATALHLIFSPCCFLVTCSYCVFECIIVSYYRFLQSVLLLTVYVLFVTGFAKTRHFPHLTKTEINTVTKSLPFEGVIIEIWKRSAIQVPRYSRRCLS